VDRLSEALSADPTLPGHPFADELNHLSEHSIELAAVWLHHTLGQPVTMLPVLCGSLHTYVDAPARTAGGEGLSPAHVKHIADAMEVLRQTARRRRTVFIAAADLAHVGPAFGDATPAGEARRTLVRSADAALLDAFCLGDKEGSLANVRSVADAYRICGLAPMYMTMWAAGEGRGRWFAYDQCPADAENASFVSIAGALLYRD
jgi:hypothetical protein